METTTQQNVKVSSKAGKGLSVSGFVISLTALVLWLFISAAAVISAAIGGGMGLASFWLIFSITGLALSALGFVKANKAGAKKGLAITGIVIGSIAVLLSISTVSGVSKAQDEFAKAGLGNNIMETLKAGK